MLRGLFAAVLTLGLLLARVAIGHPPALYTIDIPAGPLREAIEKLAASAHLQVLYAPAVVSGKMTEGVRGSMSLTQAFDHLLVGTNVTFQFTSDDTVALYQRAALAADTPPMTSPRQAPVAPPPLPVVHVSAQRTAQGDDAGTGMSLSSIKTDGSVLVTPITLQSVTGDVLQDQQAGRVEDVLEGVSGIEVAPDGQDTVGFIIRGIPVYQYYVDGVRISPDLHHDAFRDLADVASIDVVKGPASTLYGRTEPGGLINIVTKQPLRNPFFSFEQQLGAFDRKRTQLDAGGPLNQAGSVLYRFNAASEDAHSYREHSSNRRIFLAPVLTWDISERSAVTAYLEYLRSHDPTDSGLPVIGASMPPVSVRRRVEDGGAVHTRDVRVGLRGWHAIDDRWTLRYHLDGRWLRTPQWPQLALADDGLDPAGCTRTACPIDQVLFSIPVARGQTYFSSMEFLGDVELWNTRHAILFGGEFFDVHGDSVTLYSQNAFQTDLFAPRHGRVPGYLLQSPDGAFATWSSERWSSAYLQDQIRIGPSLHILLGVRYDHARQWLDTAFGIPLQDAGTDVRWDHAFKRHAGIVWQFAEPISLYANYAENFGISTGIYGEGEGGGTGILVPPETAAEWEVGAKAALLEGRLSGSLAWFDLTERNISLPAFGLLDFQGVRTVTGSEHSRGLEFDVRGTVWPHLDLLASYAYLDTRILSDVGAAVDNSGNIFQTPGNTGNRLFGAPRHGGSAWLTYRPGGRLEGLRLGLGTVARTWREGDNENDYRIPGFTRWSVLAGYEWPWQHGQLAVQLNVNNMFNTRYFESISGTHTVMPGAPRLWLARIRWTAVAR